MLNIRERISSYEKFENFKVDTRPGRVMNEDLLFHQPSAKYVRKSKETY